MNRFARAQEAAATAGSWAAVADLVALGRFAPARATDNFRLRMAVADLAASSVGFAQVADNDRLGRVGTLDCLALAGCFLFGCHR